MSRRVAETELEWLKLIASGEDGFVRNIDDWKKLLNSDQNPLKSVQEEIVKEFTENLTFKNGGLAHANYSFLQDAITIRQFRDLWEYFGMSWNVAEDHDGYRCKSKGTCSKSVMDICTSNCIAAGPIRVKKVLRNEMARIDTDDLMAAFQNASQISGKEWEAAKSDPNHFLENAGLDLPNDIHVSFEERDLTEPPDPDLSRLGVVGWRCFKWCKISVDPDDTPVMRCYDVCLPVFKK